MKTTKTVLALAALLAGAAPLSTPAIQAADVIDAGASWKYIDGRSEASSPDATAWTRNPFDDQAWKSGVGPFHFGKPFAGTEAALRRRSRRGAGQTLDIFHRPRPWLQTLAAIPGRWIVDREIILRSDRSTRCLRISRKFQLIALRLCARLFPLC